MPVDADTIAFAHKLADASGAVIRPYFRRRIDVSDKGAKDGAAFDPVTAAAREFRCHPDRDPTALPV